jgi:hypothetical protein
MGTARAAKQATSKRKLAAGIGTHSIKLLHENA